MPTNAYKKELSLQKNVFGSPAEKVNVEAWTQLVLNLLFMKQGTYPSSPLMGCDLEVIDFADVQDDIPRMIRQWDDQIKTYLPDIPYVSMNAELIDTDEVPASRGVIVLTINFQYNGNITTAVVATTKVNKLIDFTIRF